MAAEAAKPRGIGDRGGFNAIMWGWAENGLWA